MAAGPFPGNGNSELKVEEMTYVSDDGVDETDTATNTGVAKNKNHDPAIEETVASKETVGDKTSKATAEIRHSMEEEKTCSRERAMKGGVDHTKILIGPGMEGVLPLDTVSPRKYTGKNAKTKVVGGTCIREDTEVPSMVGVDCTGVSGVTRASHGEQCLRPWTKKIVSSTTGSSLPPAPHVCIPLSQKRPRVPFRPAGRRRLPSLATHLLPKREW